MAATAERTESRPILRGVSMQCPLCEGKGKDYIYDGDCIGCRGTGRRDRPADFQQHGDVWTFHIPSSTDIHTTYRIDYYRGQPICDCPGYRPWNYCHHAREVEQAMSETGTIALREPAERQAGQLAPLTVAPPRDLLPTERDLAIIKMISNAAGKTGGGGIVPKHITSPEQAACVMLYGWELGLRPMTALQHVNLINGRSSLSAQAMMGIVMAKMPTARFIFHETTAKRADIELRIPGREPLRLPYTIEEAIASGQVARSRGQNAKGVWDQYAADMLRHHVIKRLCRFGAANLINAIDGVDMSTQIAMSEAMHELPAAESEMHAIPPDAYNPGDYPGNIPDSPIVGTPLAASDMPQAAEDLALEAEDPTAMRSEWPAVLKRHGVAGWTEADNLKCFTTILGCEIRSPEALTAEDWRKCQQDLGWYLNTLKEVERAPDTAQPSLAAEMTENDPFKDD